MLEQHSFFSGLLSIFCPVCYASALSVRLKEMILVPCFPGGIATMRTKMRLNNDIEVSIAQYVGLVDYNVRQD